MQDGTQTRAGRHVMAKVVVSMTERQYAAWRRAHSPIGSKEASK